ncbi:MAG: GNAT family N-acetyltransferase [bacterium]
MKFVKIEVNQVDEVFIFLKNSAILLKNRNINYWKNWIDPSEESIKWIIQGLKDQQFYHVYENENLIGMFRLLFEDKSFWGIRNDKAGYIHSFAIDQKYCGKKKGYQVLSKIEELLSKSNYNFLRLDCGKSNLPLCKYYENYGFNIVGEIIVDENEIVLMEKLL